MEAAQERSSASKPRKQFATRMIVLGLFVIAIVLRYSLINTVYQQKSIIPLQTAKQTIEMDAPVEIERDSKEEQKQKGETKSKNENNSTELTHQRGHQFLYPSDIPQRRVIWSNHSLFSGAYLIPIRRLLSVPVEKISNLEGATFLVMRYNREYNRMSVDWLDLAVEHLSGWIKHMNLFNDQHNDVAIVKLMTNLGRYIRETPARVKTLPLVPQAWDSLESLRSNAATNTTKSSSQQLPKQLPMLHRTIGVVAAGTWFDRTSIVGAERSQNVTIAVMGGTVASMMRVGFGRIVLVTATDEDVVAAKKTIAMIRRQFRSYANSTLKITSDNDDNDNGNIVVDTMNIELTYVVATEELYQASKVKIHRVKAAIYGIKQAVVGNFNASYTNQWLGTRQPHDYWKHVYVTENDLLLQTRPSALSSIHKALEEEYVLFPYRLNIVPHELDLTDEEGRKYNGTKAMLPSKFDNILSLNGDEDMCCDGGKDHPNSNITMDVPGDLNHCYHKFFLCGFRKGRKGFGNLTDELRHRRVLKHLPFYRLRQGFDTVIVPATNTRRCHPRKRRSPEDFCAPHAPDFEAIAKFEKKAKKASGRRRAVRK